MRVSPKTSRSAATITGARVVPPGASTRATIVRTCASVRMRGAGGCSPEAPIRGPNNG
jgi:hypothetical protein